MATQNPAFMSDVQKFWASFVLICVASLGLHVLVFSKRPGRYQHHTPVYPDSAQETLVPNETPLEGRVTVLGTDRFYLDVQGRQHMFLFGAEARPAPNDRIRVFYFKASPPIVRKWERL